MMTTWRGAAFLAAMLSMVTAGCNHLPGKPGFRPETLRPDQTLNFRILYRQNCSACHGNDGLKGAALPLNNPVYLAWAGQDNMLPIVATGASLRSMHAFAKSDGGLLTDQQIENIVHGMIARWGKPDALNGANPPGYAPSTPPDAKAGQAAFQTYCARCHGADGKGLASGASNAGDHAVGSIIDPTYLSLISDRGLRDIIVAGLPGEGMPDWRGDAPGTPLTDKDVTNVVAWLGSHRVQFPGQPFPPSSPMSAEHPAAGK